MRHGSSSGERQTFARAMEPIEINKGSLSQRISAAAGEGGRKIIVFFIYVRYRDSRHFALRAEKDCLKWSEKINEFKKSKESGAAGGGGI